MAAGGAYALTQGGSGRPSGGAGLPGGGTPIKYKPTSVRSAQKPPARPAPRPAHPTPSAAKPTNPLAPLGPQQIRQQATKTINAAYQGALGSVDNQTQQAQNLYKTQQTDDAAFQQWLASNAQAMQAQTDTVNQKLTDVLTGMRATQQTQLNAVPGQLAGQVAQPGSTSQQNLQDSLTRLTSPYLNAAEQHANTAGIQQAETAMGGNNLLAGTSQVAAGRIAQVSTAQTANLDKTMQSIAAERSKLISARTGDIAKEIARLNSIEISKAQFTTNQAALEQKLGIQQQSANATSANAVTNAANAQVNAQRAAESQRHNVAIENINSQHYATQAQHDAAVQAETARHNKVTEGIAQQNANTRGTGAPGGVKPGTPQQQAAIRSKIGQVRQMLIWDINTYHRGDPNALSLAWHDLQNGNFMSARYGHRNAQGVYVPGPRVPVNQDVGIINAAANTLTQYGAQGLTPGDVQWLQGQGLSNVSGYYPTKGSKPQNGKPGNKG